MKLRPKGGFFLVCYTFARGYHYMKKYIFFLLFISISSWSQFRFQGIVRDSITQKSIPFVTLHAKGISMLSDVNGFFEWKGESAIDVVTLSYLGYQRQVVKVNPKAPMKILMVPTENQEKVTRAAEEKGKTFIHKVHLRAPSNNPQIRLNTFKHNGYHRLVVTAPPDSIKGTIDSTYSKKEEKFSPDSTSFKFKELISKQHLFQFEKASSYQYNGEQFKETIIGTKMSGFKKPVYEVISFHLQPQSIYNNIYELFETKYVNPISNLGLKSYHFVWLDSVNIEGRKTQLIYFKNKKRFLRRGLEGVLFIDSETFGIAKAIYRIRGMLDISSLHHFNFESTLGLWLPSKNEFKIVKGQNDDPIKILGGTIRFEGDYDPFNENTKSEISDYVYVYAQSQFYDWEYNLPINFKRKHISLEITDDAIKREDDFWKYYRKDSLNARDVTTYKALDSLFFKEKWENKLLFGRKIINGYVPLGPMDFDLRYLLSFNNYEGFRLGLGGITNELFSKKIRFEGYGAYGTKDGTFKYMGGFATRIGKTSQSWTGISYTNDVREIASTKFNIDKRVFKIYDPRPINVSTFYRHRTWKTYLETRILPKTEAIWQLSNSEVTPLFPYQFTANGRAYQNFTMTTAQVSISWSPFSDFMQTPVGKMEMEKRFPKFTFQYTQSLPEILNNDFDFGKIDFRAEYERNFISGQKASIAAQGGYAFGDVPLTHLYNTSPNNLSRDRLLQRITVAGSNSFETMYFNEFFSSRYVMIHSKFGFKRVQLFNKVKPSMVLVTRMAWGDMHQPEKHVGINYKTLNRGYFESGVELNQIFYGFGLAGFFRYGPYQLPKFENNLALKLTFKLDLGL
jgi:hypothetical protein